MMEALQDRYPILPKTLPQISKIATAMQENRSLRQDAIQICGKLLVACDIAGGSAKANVEKLQRSKPYCTVTNIRMQRKVEQCP